MRAKTRSARSSINAIKTITTSHRRRCKALSNGEEEAKSPCWTARQRLVGGNMRTEEEAASDLLVQVREGLGCLGGLRVWSGASWDDIWLGRFSVSPVHLQGSR